MSYIVKQINPIGKGTPFKKKAYGILSLLQIFLIKIKNCFGPQHRLSQAPTAGRRSTNSKRVHAARRKVENMP